MNEKYRPDGFCRASTRSASIAAHAPCCHLLQEWHSKEGLPPAGMSQVMHLERSGISNDSDGGKPKAGKSLLFCVFLASFTSSAITSGAGVIGGCETGSSSGFSLSPGFIMARVEYEGLVITIGLSADLERILPAWGRRSPLDPAELGMEVFVLVGFPVTFGDATVAAFFGLHGGQRYVFFSSGEYLTLPHVK